MNMSYLIGLQETIIDNMPPAPSATTIALAMSLAKEFAICQVTEQDPYPTIVEHIDFGWPASGPAAVPDSSRALLALLVIEFDRNWIGAKK